MLSFLSPLFLAGAAAAAIPIVLHLLRREPEPRVKFAAVKLLKQAPVEKTEKRHLRELLLLALRVATLILLAFAFARPFFAHGAALGSTGITIVAIDTSYSMSAPGRFARAQSLAKDAVRRASSSDMIGVLAFDDQAEMVAKPSGDRELALTAIDRVQPGFGGTRYRAGLNAAAQALEGRRGTIVVVTDLQESGWDIGDRAAVPESARIEVADVGDLPPNVAVESVRADGDRVTATIRNTGPRAHLALDGKPAADATISLPANGAAEVALGARGRAKTAAVNVDDRTGLQADNTRYLVLDGGALPTLLVVTANGDPARDAFYARHALGVVGEQGGGFQVVGVSGAQLSTWDPSRVDGNAAVLLLSTRGLERRGRETLARYVERGGGLFIAAGPDVDGEVAADALGVDAPLRIAVEQDSKPTPRTLAPADVRHPVFQAFGTGAAALGLVRFQSVARISGDGCQTLARFTTSEAAMIECPAGEGRGVIFASDLDNHWNDFPLHPTFVPFLQEVARYLASGRSAANEYLVGTPGLPATPGIHQLAADSRTGAPARQIAVNVDPREADATRISAAGFESTVTRLKAAAAADARIEATQQEDRQHLWQYVLVMMILALAVEGLVASRTA